MLESGVTDDSIELFEWRTTVENGALDEARSDVAVIVLDESGDPGPRWEVRNAWPSRYVAPTLAGTGKDVAIERLEIVHEGMERVELYGGVYRSSVLGGVSCGDSHRSIRTPSVRR